MQHVAVTPLSALKKQGSDATTNAQAAAAAAEEAMRARTAAVRSAKVAYCKALHLNPTQGVF
jgi:hypothetical protein